MIVFNGMKDPNTQMKAQCMLTPSKKPKLDFLQVTITGINSNVAAHTTEQLVPVSLT